MYYFIVLGVVVFVLLLVVMSEAVVKNLFLIVSSGYSFCFIGSGKSGEST